MFGLRRENDRKRGMGCSTPTRVGFGSTAVHPYPVGDWQQWVESAIRISRLGLLLGLCALGAPELWPQRDESRFRPEWRLAVSPRRRCKAPKPSGIAVLNP